MLRLDSSVGGLEFFAPGCLAGKKKCLSILALSAELERAEIFEPGTFGDIRSCLQPDPETVEVVEAHVTVVHAFDQMIANGCGDAPPGLDLGHYSPKTRRPNSSPNRLACCESLAARKRPASSKKAFSFCFRASMPSSMSSTRIRLSLKRWLFAMRSTCLAMGVGSDMLRRTCFVVGMASLHTNLVHFVRTRTQSPHPVAKNATRIGAQSCHFSV